MLLGGDGNEEPHWFVTELSIPAIRIPWAQLDFSIARLGAVSIDSGYYCSVCPHGPGSTGATFSDDAP